MTPARPRGREPGQMRPLRFGPGFTRHAAGSVLAEFGTFPPENKQVRVHDSNADLRYLVLPQPPAGTEGCSED